MSAPVIVAYIVAGLCTMLAGSALYRRTRGLAAWSYFTGMLLFAVENLLLAQAFQSVTPAHLEYWLSLVLYIASLQPATWLLFSLVYSRGNYGEFLRRWRVALLLAVVLPVALACLPRNELLTGGNLGEPGGELTWWVAFGPAAKMLNISLLIASILILMNLENTLRSAVGTMKWRIKFLVLGLGTIFGTHIYTKTQMLLFSGHTLSLLGVEVVALGLGSLLMVMAYLRNGVSGIEVYPSRAVLRSSVTVLLAGGYLLAVGLLAKVVAALGNGGNFELKALLVLAGIAALAVLLLSQRLHQSVQDFVSRHFKRPQHDFREVWNTFTRNIPSAQTPPKLCELTAQLISQSLKALSVTVWLVDEQHQRLQFAASTAPLPEKNLVLSDENSHAILEGLRKVSRPFNLEPQHSPWAAPLLALTPAQFRTGGHRIGVPLLAGDELLGIITLADRVGGLRYSPEELDLLKCIGDQVAAAVLSLRLREELMRSKELEAFQTMSAFFVHDLKNAASRLSLMLQNLPIHFDDREFREDALRGIGNTVTHINHLVRRLSVLRNKLQLQPVELNVSELLDESLHCLEPTPGIRVRKSLQNVPALKADREQLQNVFTNLLLNARDALHGAGEITISSQQTNGDVVAIVSDTGCGMEPTFLQSQLFRPFQTTKQAGLGIGMFQSKLIVEAHRGSIDVESQPGKGTTFRVRLPLCPSNPNC